MRGAPGTLERMLVSRLLAAALAAAVALTVAPAAATAAKPKRKAKTTISGDAWVSKTTESRCPLIGSDGSAWQVRIWTVRTEFKFKGDSDSGVVKVTGNDEIGGESYTQNRPDGDVRHTDETIRTVLENRTIPFGQVVEMSKSSAKVRMNGLASLKHTVTVPLKGRSGSAALGYTPINRDGTDGPCTSKETLTAGGTVKLAR